MVISMVSIKVSIKVRQNINKIKWMNHISALRDFLEIHENRFNRCKYVEISEKIGGNMYYNSVYK